MKNTWNKIDLDDFSTLPENEKFVIDNRLKNLKERLDAEMVAVFNPGPIPFTPIEIEEQRLNAEMLRQLFSGTGKEVKNIKKGGTYEILSSRTECKSDDFDGERLVTYTDGKNIYSRGFNEFLAKYSTLDGAAITPEWLDETIDSLFEKMPDQLKRPH